MNSGQSGYEHAIVDFYAHNIVVALPLTILMIKILVRFFTREPAKDIFRSILVLPLDLIYVAFGILLAGMAGRIPAFTSHYESERDAFNGGIVLCLTLFVAACIVTWLDRFLRVLWQKFYAAWSLSKQVQSDGTQLLLPGQPNIKRIAVIYLWMFAYWSLMISVTSLQSVLSVEVFGVILKRIQ